MVSFEQRCEALIRVFNQWKATKGASQPPRNALLRFVDDLANVAEYFLRIHPYMDGNGHSVRMLLYLMMTRAGYLPKNWAIDDKQPYASALSEYRDGKRGALQVFFLTAITG